jgi:hypothetical protein
VFTSSAITVRVSSGSSLALADPGSRQTGTVTLSATSEASAAEVVFQRSPAGAGTWTTIATDTSFPWSARFDTKAVADGSYDLRAVAYDSTGSALSTARRSALTIDNTRPRVVSSLPADGSIVASASPISLTTNETLSRAASVTLDGAAATPTVSGSSATVNSGPLPAGPHVVEGRLVDAGGTRGAFRVAFTIPSSGGEAAYVEKNTAPDSSTSVRSLGGAVSVTMPSGAYGARSASAEGRDWLVLRVDPTAPPTSPGVGLTAGGPAVDVTATSAVAGTRMTSFTVPLDIVLTNTTGENVVAAMFENGAWRVIPKLAVAGTLPAGQQDGFDARTDGVHILTRHLTRFALLDDTAAPTAPTGLAGTIASGSLTLTWTPGTDDGANATTILYVNGVEFECYDGSVSTATIGPFRAATRGRLRSPPSAPPATQAR